MRGYHISPVAAEESLGSIPADAGLPVVEGVSTISSWVYPRGCGATQVEDKGIVDSQFVHHVDFDTQQGVLNDEAVGRLAGVQLDV